MTSKQRNEIQAFMNQNPMAVISTLSAISKKPESALIAFAELEGFEILFETFYDTRKYHNLKKDNRVSMVIGWDTKSYITLQYEGKAEPVAKEDYETYIQKFLAKKTPCTEEFLYDDRVRLYVIKPTWLRYSDYTTKQPTIIEHSF